MPDQFDDDLFFDSNGCLTERRWLDGQEVIVHYDDIPDKDLTTVRGHLDERANDGWHLGAPVDGGWAHLIRTPAVSDGSAQHS